MKQATVKSLGVAALGAAFAATSAGSASAIGDVMQVLPVESAIQALPVDEVQSLTADQMLSQTGHVDQVQGAPAQDDLLGGVVDQLAADPGQLTSDPGQLLGGLPLDSVKI